MLAILCTVYCFLRKSAIAYASVLRFEFNTENAEPEFAFFKRGRIQNLQAAPDPDESGKD